MPIKIKRAKMIESLTAAVGKAYFLKHAYQCSHRNGIEPANVSWV
jgi:hypothetical protein